MHLSKPESSKASLRNYYKQIRKCLNPEYKKRIDKLIQLNLLNTINYIDSSIIFAYVSKQHEVDTSLIINKAFKDKKTIALPKCEKNNIIKFYKVTSLDDLELNKNFGILEPIKTESTAIRDLTKGLCIVPGLCFDIQGFRLGYGMGYYDRFLKNFGGDKIGICYSNCILPELPRNSFDEPVDLLVTELLVHKTSPGY
jgi:5-formyltetrahydrofolate cyclo-ligase